jgi:hypothetical protein
MRKSRSLFTLMPQKLIILTQDQHASIVVEKVTLLIGVGLRILI